MKDIILNVLKECSHYERIWMDWGQCITERDFNRVAHAISQAIEEHLQNANDEREGDDEL